MMLNPPLGAAQWSNADPKTRWRNVKDEDLVASLRADRDSCNSVVLKSAENYLVSRVRRIVSGLARGSDVDAIVQNVGWRVLLEAERDASANLELTGHHVDFGGTVTFDALDELRAITRQRRLNPSVGGTSDDEPKPEVRDRPETHALLDMQDALLDRIEAAIADEVDRKVFRLTREAVEVKDIAAEVNKSVSSVYQTRSRLYKKLGRTRRLVELYEEYLEAEHETWKGHAIGPWDGSPKGRKRPSTASPKKSGNENGKGSTEEVGT